MHGVSKRWSGLLGGLASVLSSRAAAEEILTTTTTTAGGWIQDGVMMDVGVTAGSNLDPSVNIPDGITVVGFDVVTPSQEEVCVEIYSKSGSLEGFESDETAWTFLGSVSVKGQGKDALTPIPVGSFDFGKETFIPAGETRSFYVTTQDQNLRYTAYPDGTHTTGSVFVSDTIELGGPAVERVAAPDTMEVNVYTGVAKDYPFGPTWKDRMFNGNILYTLGSDTNSVSLAADAKAAGRGKVKCDQTVSPTATPTLSSVPTSTPSNAESTLKSLATIQFGGLLQSGNMFDVSVLPVEEGGPPEGITVLAMEMSTTSTDEICVELYSKDGTYVGSEEVPSDWDMMGAVTVTGQGASEGTRLPLGSMDPLYIGPGESRGIYITTKEPVIRYTSPLYGEQAGDVFSKDDSLQIHIGSVNGYNFKGFEQNRIWNGALIYALGNQNDGKYSELTADTRPRSCSVEEDLDTAAGDDTAATVAENSTTADIDAASDANAPMDTDTTTDADTINNDSVTEDTTNSATEDTTNSATEEETPTTSTGLSNLVGYCNETTSPGDSKEVVLNYKYAVITDDSANAEGVATGMEEEIHDVMMIDKCEIGTSGRKLQASEEGVSFIGFKSLPADVVSSDSCPKSTDVPEGKVCSVVEGGITAIVPTDANEADVRQSMSSLLQQILSNKAIATDVGATGIAYIPSDTIPQEAGEDALAETGVSTGKDDVTSTAPGFGSASTKAESGGVSGMSTTQIIIIAAVCGGILVVVILGMVLMRRKRKKRADERALFNEFPDEEGYGVNLALGKSDDPLDAPTQTHSWVSSEGVEAAQFPWQQSALILNEQDEISIISNDKSKFSPSRMLSPNSGSSVSSRSSSGKKNVEFIKAGRSFASNRSNQPDDTVDL